MFAVCNTLSTSSSTPSSSKSCWSPDIAKRRSDSFLRSSFERRPPPATYAFAPSITLFAPSGPPTPGRPASSSTCARELADRAPAELEQRLGDLLIELGSDRVSDLLFRSALELVDLRFGVNIDAPARELRREPDVLALLADRERELVVGDDQLHAMAFGVDDDALDLGRCDRVADEARRVVIVRDDVDLLAAQLLHDGLDAAALHADARADRIDIAIARRHGDLRARTGLASRALDADDLLVDLRDLLLEQLLEQALVRARQDH